MRTIIVDDEWYNLKHLSQILQEHYPEIKILQTFENIEEAIHFLSTNTIDLLFLDIQFQHKTGFELLEQFPDRTFQVIFVTAYDEYAIKAIKSGATDYILKPILLEELDNAILQVKKKIYPITPDAPLIINHSNGKEIISPKNLMYIQGLDNISKLYLTDARKITVTKTLKHFEQLLDHRFIRIHKSFIVNIAFCEAIETKEQYFVKLKGNIKLPVSRRQQKILNNRLCQK